jgi:hypothetical protein
MTPLISPYVSNGQEVRTNTIKISKNQASPSKSAQRGGSRAFSAPAREAVDERDEWLRDPDRIKLAYVYRPSLANG